MSERLRHLGLFLILFSILRIGSAFGSMEIKTISIEPFSENESLRELIPFQPGDVWNSALVDILEKYLVSTQQFNRARVSFDEKTQNLMISVEPRKFFKEYLWTEFKPNGASDIEQICFNRMESVEIPQSRISQINQCILRAVQRQGYLDAKVLLIPDDTVLKIDLLPGDRYRIRKINFEGNEYFNQRFLELMLNLNPGVIFNPFDIREKTSELRALYLERGFFSSEIFQATAHILPAQRQVDLTWKIVEGDRYEVSFEGYHHAKAIFHDYLERGEALPSWFLEELGESIEEDLKQKGYLNAEVKKIEKRVSDRLIRVRYSIEPGIQFRLVAPRFIGIDEIDQILKIYEQIGPLRVGKRFHERSFEEVFVTKFFERILDSGYVEARVQALEFSIDQARATVEPLIYMNLGPRYIIDEVQILGEPEGFEDLLGFQAIRHSTRSGQIFNPKNVDELQDNLQKELQANGFLDAEVSRIDENFSTQGFSFKIQVTPGPRYRIASVLIRGIEKTQPIVIFSELLFERGDFYSDQAIKDTVSQILRLSIARSVDIRIFDKIPEEGLVYLVVDLVEAARFRFEIGPGYGTVDGIRATLRATYANIGGTGRRLSFVAKASRRLEESKTPIDVVGGDAEAKPFIERRLILEYLEPAVFRMPLDFRLTFSHRKESEDDLDQVSNSITGAFDYRISRHWTYTPEYRVEISDPFNVKLTSTIEDTSQKRLHSLNQTLRLSYLDENFNPLEGVRNILNFELYDRRLGGTREFWILTNKTEVFIPLFNWLTPRDINFSFAINSGFSLPFGRTSEIPVEKRFRVGGERSVRGYSEGGIEPPQRNGEALVNGGQSLFFFRTELAFPVFGSVDLLGFLDGGNIYARNSDFNPFDLRYGAGLGFRFNTLFGPLKMGYAVKLDRQINEKFGQIYFGVGTL